MKTTLLAVFLLLGACADHGGQPSTEPTTSVEPATPVDACDESQFAGTFAVPRVEHVGTTDFCGPAAERWNAAESARDVRFWRNLDGSWTDSGQTTYALNRADCTLGNVVVTAVGARDLEGGSARVPLRIVTTVHQHAEGVVINVEEGFDAASNVPGLPCTIDSSTTATRL